MSKQDIRQDNTQVVAEGRSTVDSIREQILSIPANEDFVIVIPIGGDPDADEN